MSKRLSYYRAIVLLIALAGGAARAGDQRVICPGVVAPYTTPGGTGLLDRLMAPVCREAGVEAEVLVYPTASERSLLNGNAGIDAGQAPSDRRRTVSRARGQAGERAPPPGRQASRWISSIL